MRVNIDPLVSVSLSDSLQCDSEGDDDKVSGFLASHIRQPVYVHTYKWAST